MRNIVCCHVGRPGMTVVAVVVVLLLVDDICNNEEVEPKLRRSSPDCLVRNAQDVGHKVDQQHDTNKDPVRIILRGHIFLVPSMRGCGSRI
jgi:hypothetical protein